MKIIVLVFSVLISIAAFYYGIKMLRLYFRVKKWAKVKANILNKAIAPRRLANASRANLIIVVEYSYNYLGKNYKGNKIFLAELLKGERTFYRDDAEKFLNRLKPEENVYVNPENPERSVMFCDGPFLYFLVFLMGFVSLLVGLGNYFS